MVMRKSLLWLLEEAAEIKRGYKLDCSKLTD